MRLVGFAERLTLEPGKTSAMYDLGAMYENGEDVVKDQQQAVEWYSTAGALGEQHTHPLLRRLGLAA
jgi:TPR repeat protein